MFLSCLVFKPNCKLQLLLNCSNMQYIHKVCIVVLLALLILGLRSSADGACIQSYQELQASLFARQQNIDNLRRAFFPINQEPSISIEIEYYFRNNWTLPYPLVFRWSTSRSLGLIRPELMQSLTLHIFNRITPVVEIIMDPICDDPNLHSSLSNWEGICTDEKMASFTLQLLNELTANVSNVFLLLQSIQFYCKF